MRLECLVILAAIALLAACGSAPPRLSYASYGSATMNAEVRYAVYTPRGFSRNERLPLVVFLHGAGDSERAFDRWKLGERLDRAIARGEIPRVVVVVPDGDMGFWHDWYDRSRFYETWVVRELMPRVQREQHTLPCPEGCHLVGVSMGGTAAIRFALHEPGRFASVTALSALVLDTDDMIEIANSRLFSIFVPTHRVFGPTERRDLWRIRRSDPFVRWRDPEDLEGTRLFVAWAERDAALIRRTNVALVRHLGHRHIAHVQRELPGDHSWHTWSPAIVDALRVQLAGRPARRGRAAPAAIRTMSRAP